MDLERLHNIWYGMRQRCNNPQSEDYKNYGGRGIKICDEWDTAQHFIEWAIKNGYQDNLTIDRKNVNENYSPVNCQWITIEQQQRNRRNNHLITFNNETHCLSEWDEICSFPSGTIRTRLARGWSEKRALTTPQRTPPNSYKYILTYPDGTRQEFSGTQDLRGRTGINPRTMKKLLDKEPFQRKTKWSFYKLEKIILDNK